LVNGASTYVIYNPAAGRGRAYERLESLRSQLRDKAVFAPTERPGHAEELAFEAGKRGFAIIGAAGGDGTVHEVANGLLRAEGLRTVMAIFPIGSANDYAFSLGLKPAWWLDPVETNGPACRPKPVDVGLVQTPAGKRRYFINGLGLGFNGAVTLESQRIRWLQGVPLYTAALLRALVYRFHAPLMSICIDGVAHESRTLALTVAIGRREGNFLLAPKARVDDGYFDYLLAGALDRWELIRYLPGMITGNLPTEHPKLRIGLCREVLLHTDTPVPVHIDGEIFCRPEDGVYDLEIQVLPARLSVLRPG
jgi:diacylglycerol kinase family enzyme